MFMKYRKILALLAASIIIANDVNANGQGSHVLNGTTATNLNSEPTIFTYIAYTDHYYWCIATDENYAGTSTTAPCSDMTIISGGDGFTLITNYTDKFSSEFLVKTIGPGKTCYRSDRTIAGSKHLKVSTGDIQLLWDESSKTYVAATPDKVTLDFSSGDQ
jgi:hypothetical protein